MFSAQPILDDLLVFTQISNFRMASLPSACCLSSLGSFCEVSRRISVTVIGAPASEYCLGTHQPGTPPPNLLPPLCFWPAAALRLWGIARVCEGLRCQPERLSQLATAASPPLHPPVPTTHSFSLAHFRTHHPHDSSPSPAFFALPPRCYIRRIPQLRRPSPLHFRIIDPAS